MKLIAVIVIFLSQTSDMAYTVDHGPPPPSHPLETILPISPPCIVDGPMFQAVYVYTTTPPTDDIIDRIRRGVGEANGIFLESFGRDMRVAVDDDCQVSVISVQVTTVNVFSALMGELIEQGFVGPDRKYLVFAEGSDICGISSIYDDDSPGPFNRNEMSTSYALMGQVGCWGGRVVAHEAGHGLGAVQRSAPNASRVPEWHCTDEYDIMCYGPEVRVVCPDPRGEGRFDCNGDDYGNPFPPPRSYIANHLNIAMSRYLYDPLPIKLFFPHVEGDSNATSGEYRLGYASP